MKIAIGSDHAGYKLKEHIKKYLDTKKIEYKDFGTHSLDSCDYPDIAEKVSKAVVNDEYERGIIICGSGIGVCITANKIKGIRAAVCHDIFSAKYSRYHNDVNILTMGENIIGFGLAIEILEAWLGANFEGGRHLSRIEKISEIEKNI